MPTTFTTHYGSLSHGFEIEWTNDPTASTLTLQAVMTANMYADMLLASSTYTTATYYFGKDTIYTTGNQFSTDSLIYIDGTNPFPQFEFLVIMQDASSDCTGVCRDGWQILLNQELTYSSDTSTYASGVSAWTCAYVAKSYTLAYDKKPGASYVFQDDAAETCAEGATCTVNTNDNVSTNVLTNANTGGYCMEIWEVVIATVASKSCVKYQASITRNFDTSDTTNDFIVDYIPYNIRVRFGPTTISSENTAYQYDDQLTDFAYFKAGEAIEGAMSLSQSSLLATGLAVAMYAIHF